MKKLAGIVLIAAALVGAPLAWHMHSPLPFLPQFGLPETPFPPDQAPPPPEGEGGEGPSEDQSESATGAALPTAPSSSYSPAPPTLPPAEPFAPSPPMGEDFAFTLEASVSPAPPLEGGLDQGQGSITLPSSSLGGAMDIPPPLPALAPAPKQP